MAAPGSSGSGRSRCARADRVGRPSAARGYRGYGRPRGLRRGRAWGSSGSGRSRCARADRVGRPSAARGYRGYGRPRGLRRGRAWGSSGSGRSRCARADRVGRPSAARGYRGYGRPRGLRRGRAWCRRTAWPRVAAHAWPQEVLRCVVRDPSDQEKWGCAASWAAGRGKSHRRRADDRPGGPRGLTGVGGHRTPHGRDVSGGPAASSLRVGRTAAVSGLPRRCRAVTVPAVRSPAAMPWAPGP